MAKSGFKKNFRTGAGGLRAGAGATGGFSSKIREAGGASVWADSVPVGYWNFEDGTGITLSDVSSAGNSLDGTLRGTDSGGGEVVATWDSTDKVRGSYSLDFQATSGQLVSVADNSVLDFDPDQSFSVSVWFKRNTTMGNDQGSLVSKMSKTVKAPDPNAFRGYDIYIQNKLLIFLLYEQNTAYLQVRYNVAINDTNWHHLLVTYGGADSADPDVLDVTMYLDNSSVVLTELIDTLETDDITVSATDFAIGARGFGGNTSIGSTSQRWYGNLDEVAVWNKELSSDEVDDVYNSGAGNDLTDGIPKS